MGFNPADYLTAQGWAGPGSGFTPTARSKPIPAIQKKNQFGVGKDRDTSYPWWDDVFSKIASKVGKPKQEPGLAIAVKTVTGLISPLPPPENVAKSNHSQNTPASNLNVEVIHVAKQNAIRQDLYRRFLRGSTIVGTNQDETKRPMPEEPLSLSITNDVQPDNVTDHDQKLSKKPKNKASKSSRKKRKRESNSIDSTSLPDDCKLKISLAASIDKAPRNWCENMEEHQSSKNEVKEKKHRSMGKHTKQKHKQKSKITSLPSDSETNITSSDYQNLNKRQKKHKAPKTLGKTGKVGSSSTDSYSQTLDDGSSNTTGNLVDKPLHQSKQAFEDCHSSKGDVIEKSHRPSKKHQRRKDRRKTETES